MARRANHQGWVRAPDARTPQPPEGVLDSVMKDRGPREGVLRLIGGFKLAKGLLLLAVGVGALRLLHHDVADALASLTAQLHVDPDNRYVDRAFTALLSVDDRRLKEISAGTFFYAALLLTEGTGLLLGRRWAEYFTVIATGSFIPLELYELARHITLARLAVFGINIAIVWYLIVRLRRDRRRLAEWSGDAERHAAGSDAPVTRPDRAEPSCPSNPLRLL